MLSHSARPIRREMTSFSANQGSARIAKKLGDVWGRFDGRVHKTVR